jgi:hypothetical protein
MQRPKEKDRQELRYGVAKDVFIRKMAIRNPDKFDEWLLEGVQKCPFINHNVEGDILTRISDKTKIKVINWLLEQFNHGPVESDNEFQSRTSDSGGVKAKFKRPD